MLLSSRLPISFFTSIIIVGPIVNARSSNWGKIIDFCITYGVCIIQLMAKVITLLILFNNLIEDNAYNAVRGNYHTYQISQRLRPSKKEYSIFEWIIRGGYYSKIYVYQMKYIIDISIYVTSSNVKILYLKQLNKCFDRVSRMNAKG